MRFAIALFAISSVLLNGCAPAAAPPSTSASAAAPQSAENVGAGKTMLVAATSSNAKTSEAAKSGQPHPLDKVAPLIPRRVLFGNPEKAMARMSHDGKRLAYLAPVDGVLNVWVGPIDDPSAAKPVTHEKDRPIEGYSWAYTNKHILYSQDDKGDENYHVYAVNLDTGETKDITPLEKTDAQSGKEKDTGEEPKKVRAEINGESWRTPEQIVIGLNERDPQYHDLFLVNINTGEHKLLEKNPEYSGFLLDEDNKVRFATKMNADGGEVLLKPDGKGGWEDFIKIGMEDGLTTSAAGFDKSGDVLYFIDSRGRDTGALKTIDLKTGKEKLIAENALADVGGIMAHPTENNIQGVSFTYDRTKWQFFDPAAEEDYHQLKKVADGEIQIVSRTLDDKKWLVAFLMDDGPVRYYYYDRETKKPKFLFSNRKDLENQPLQKMHPVIIQARDGLKLVSYLTLPPGSDPKGTGRPDKPLPMVLDVHGGPWARDAWGLDPEHQLWANRGYAVLSVNYRGSTGFGKKFANAGNKEWAGKMHDDLLDAVDWAVKEKIADPTKIAIVGGSYGGYATLVGLTFTPEVFACGVDEVGPSNLITLLQTIPPYWKPEIELFRKRVGDDSTTEGKKFLESRSPLSKVDNIKRPLLIGQGKNDPRVNVNEANQIVYAMQEKHIPVTYVLFPDEGHGFARPENEMAFNAVSEAFLAKILGGRYEPIGDAFEGSTITVPAGADDVPGLPEALKAAEEKSEKGS